MFKSSASKVNIFTGAGGTGISSVKSSFSDDSFSNDVWNRVSLNGIFRLNNLIYHRLYINLINFK